MKRVGIASLFIMVISVCGWAFLQSQIRSLERIGISDELVRTSIWYSLSGNYLSSPNTEKLRRIAVGDRAGVIRDIAAYAKAYVRTAEFKQKYDELRESNKPTPPEPPKTTAQRRREDKESMQKSIRESEANMKNMPAEYRASFKQSIDMMKQQLKEIDNPDNPMYSAQTEAVFKQSYEAEMEEYKNKLAEWEQRFPTKPTTMIRKWLTDFLDVSKDVDFRAALTNGENGKKVFTNADYEAKSSQWKMCFRAGKEVVEAGRSEAQRWLSELQ